VLHTLAVLLLFQCLGEAAVFVLKLPVPGPVIGMLLLFATLLLRPHLGAFAGPGMGLNGVLTALPAPWLVPVVLRPFGQVRGSRAGCLPPKAGTLRAPGLRALACAGLRDTCTFCCRRMRWTR
jgi:hypothetical protein